jgi:hypothetical protein
MSPAKSYLALSALVGFTSLAVMTAVAVGSDQNKPPPTKYVIERPTEDVVARSAAPPAAYVRKRAIEQPTEDVVAKSSVTAGAATDAFVNPKVEPGKVVWHPTFAAARKAAAQTGKPVLLFQMMGKLDDQFC